MSKRYDEASAFDDIKIEALHDAVKTKLPTVDVFIENDPSGTYIHIAIGGYSVWFGTVNETISASVQYNLDNPDGKQFDTIGLETYVLSVCPNIETVATAIVQTVGEWWQENFAFKPIPRVKA